jgi:hypothetical protein
MKPGLGGRAGHPVTHSWMKRGGAAKGAGAAIPEYPGWPPPMDNVTNKL